MAAPTAEVSGPRLPRLGQTLLGVMRPLEARLSMRERYGPVFRSNDAIVGEMFHIADRELIEQMFKWKPAEYNVGEPRQVMEPVTGPSSILLLDAQQHMRMRKLMLPPFHGEAIAHYADLIRADHESRDRHVASGADRANTHGRAENHDGGDHPGGLRHHRPRADRRAPARLAAAVVPEPAPAARPKGPRTLSPWGRFIRLRDHVDRLLYEEIEQRRDDSDRGARKDILTLLLSARDEAGEPLTDRELRDELITILLAGHETTATSIGWAFERLLRTPGALARLTAEVEAGESEDYLDAVIKETLRVRPVVPEVFRAPTESTELGGYLFAPGTQLAASILLVQFDPELYPPDPQAFRPERFLDGAPEPYTWVPFGGGVRRCLGAAFATLEMKVVISTILSRTRLRAPRAKSEKARFRGVTLLPSRGGEAVVER